MTDSNKKRKKDEEIRQSRMHQKVMQNCGMMAEIVSVISFNKVNVKFDDGATRYNANYSIFEKGALKHPSQMCDALAKQRINKEIMQNNGMIAKVKNYRKATDVDIKFADGTLVEHVRYDNFEKGLIPNPNIKYKKANSIQEFAIHYYLRKLGFRKIEQGEWEEYGFGRLELDFYHQEANVAIEYDGGLHRKLDAIERDMRKNLKCKEIGTVLYRLRDPRLNKLNDGNSINYVLNKQKQLRVGLIDCGNELKEILTKHNIDFKSNDIDFERDVNKIMDEYNATYINYYEKERVGMIEYSNPAKQYMEIIAYRDAKDMDVLFDDGEIREHVSYDKFKRGNIRHPSQTPEGLAKQRLNETKKMNNGMEATIVRYKNSEDMDVQFSDKSIRYHVSYNHFQGGRIEHPDKMRNKNKFDDLTNSDIAA